MAKKSSPRPKPELRRRSMIGEDGFWHRPELMHLAADLLFVFAAAVLAYSAVVAAVRLPFFPLREVVLDKALHRVSSAQIEFVARSVVAGNFFTVDLDAVRRAMEKQQWVRRASVRRHWPDGIALSLEEHVAAARWQSTVNRPENQFVNDHGEIFAAPLSADLVALPLFAGAEATASLLLSRYQQFSSLLSPLARKPQAVFLSPRLAWQLRLDDGLILDLGRDQPKHPLEERLRRFVAIYGEIKARHGAVGVIDMRYPSGFALRGGPKDKGKV